MDVPDPQGVKFHNGKTLTAQDVVASLKQYVTAKGSNAGLSPFFDASSVSARGQYTVVVRLKSPIGVFPYLLSQTTYQAIIQPAAIAAKPGTWVKSGMIGTGRSGSAGTSTSGAPSSSGTPTTGAGACRSRGEDHVLPGQRAAGARAAGGADRPRDAALAAGGAPVQEQLEYTYYSCRPRAPAGVHANGRGTVPGCAGAPQSRS